MIAFSLAFLQHYEKEGFGTAAHHGQTTIHPLALLGIAALCAMVLSVKRNKAVYPFILATVFLPAAQRLVIAGADFSMLRLLILAGMARVFMKNEVAGLRWRKLDTLVTSWCLVSAAAYIVLWGNVSQLIFRVGQLYDVLGMYLYFRIVVRTWGDVEGVVRFTIKLMPLLLVLFFIEKNTGKNPFHFLGANEWAAVRHGEVRVQGAFPHAILAGTYFAAFMPLVAARYFRRGGKLDAMVGAGLVLGMVYLCRSSTPLVGVTAAFIGLVGWRFRRHMRTIRWSTLGILVVLHIVMKAPVWHLISRMSFSRGSTSYHRFLLIDNAIRRFGEWMVIGIKDTAHWGHAQGDLTNQYVREGARGGFLALVLFVWALWEAFKLAGRLWRQVERNKAQRALAWGLGVSLFAQALMFLSISITHSQQNMSIFFFVLASLGCLAPRDRAPKRRKAKARPRSSGQKRERRSTPPQVRAA